MPTIQTADGAGELHYESRGDGPAVVFVHGGWMSGEMWDAQVRHFSDRYRVVTMDLLGHGGNGATERETYSVDGFADDVRLLLDELSIDSAHVCGLSLGSLVAQSYAITHPDDVRGLVLSGTMRTFPPLPITSLQQRFLFPKLWLRTGIRTLGPSAYFAGLLQWIRTAEGRPWLALDGDARAYAMEEVGRFTTDEFIKVFDSLYEFEPRDASDIAAPTLIVHGDHEASTLVSQSKQLEGTIPDASRVTIDSAGHLANMDRPEAFNRELDRFFGAI
ncbi:alpha/beta fold hydrolase [Halegenticoccus soli]|uniref:alpha/beta fold hydrolase n=1 Tax=Halegenticoccus soli TaxID=1985678 RepID=UPI000C6D2404|nr:alpha/beta fold hydrolase [Halegenticoccus soli]